MLDYHSDLNHKGCTARDERRDEIDKKRYIRRDETDKQRKSFKKKRYANLNNFNNRNAITKTRSSSGNLAINTTNWYKPLEDMKICENCKRKERDNNNIRRKALSVINEVDHINFQTRNNIEKLKFFFSNVL